VAENEAQGKEEQNSNGEVNNVEESLEEIYRDDETPNPSGKPNGWETPQPPHESTAPQRRKTSDMRKSKEERTKKTSIKLMIFDTDGDSKY